MRVVSSSETGGGEAVCRYCGSSIYADAEFCHFCFASFTLPAQELPPVRITVRSILNPWIFAGATLAFDVTAWLICAYLLRFPQFALIFWVASLVLVGGGVVMWKNERYARQAISLARKMRFSLTDPAPDLLARFPSVKTIAFLEPIGNRAEWVLSRKTRDEEILAFTSRTVELLIPIIASGGFQTHAGSDMNRAFAVIVRKGSNWPRTSIKHRLIGSAAGVAFDWMTGSESDDPRSFAERVAVECADGEFVERLLTTDVRRQLLRSGGLHVVLDHELVLVEAMWSVTRAAGAPLEHYRRQLLLARMVAEAAVRASAVSSRN